MTSHKKFIITCSAILAAMAILLIGIWVKIAQTGTVSSTSVMGSTVQQTVYGGNRDAVAQAASDKITRLDNLISWQEEDSDVAKLNEEAGVNWTTIDSLTASLLNTSLDIAQKSGGAYDPTILPISSQWDFGGQNQHVPAQTEIKKFLPYVNYKDLRVDTSDTASPSASLKLHFMAIDLSGMEKGAACEEAVKSYQTSGATGAIVAVGSSVGVYGSKPDGAPWQIAVRDPKVGKNQTVAMGQINVTSGFVSTSGIFESNFTQNGVLYHSLLNPKTGYPENNGLLSVTVWAKSGAVSDALSYACFILGKEKGEALLSEYGASGIFIDSSGKVTVTSNLKTNFVITNPAYTIEN